MSTADGWTGETACALQVALRLSNEAFAERLGIAPRTVAAWHQKPTLSPQSEMQQLLDTALEQAPQEVKNRFSALTAPGEPGQLDEKAADAERRLNADLNIVAALDWLDQQTGHPPGSARRDVAARLAAIDVHQLRDRAARRTTVDRSRIADALAEYYADRPADHGLYGADTVTTSVLTRPDWLDLDCPLTAATDRIRLTSTATNAEVPLDEPAAAQRLAETLATGVRIVDMPLFRLTTAEPTHGRLTGTFGLSRFTHYAVTMDLLEGELIDHLATGSPVAPGTLPLRDRYLPDTRAVLDLPGRLCAGGTLALFAVARPASPFRGPADYVLLVQERSGQVVNAARRLAVIPKGFHQPMTDYQADAQVGATLRREMEEELFGRADIDNTVGSDRRADPMHPSRLSEPMRWLIGQPGRLRMECTGFGLNLVSGNYEFPGLIVVEDVPR